MKLFVWTVAIVGLFATAGALWFSLGARSGLLKPHVSSLDVRGERVYSEPCADCHGRNLEGQPNWRSRDAEGYLPAPPHDANGHTRHHADALLFKITKFGVQSLAGSDYGTRMPAYKDVLGDTEIVAVLSYIKSRWPEKIQERHDRIDAAQKAQ